MLADFPVHEELHEAPLFWIDAKDNDPASEDERQRKVVAECRRLGLFVAHIPQSGKRSDYERVKLHRNGAVSGVPDLVIISRSGTLWAEMKNGKDMPSRPQTDVMNTMVRNGVWCGVYRTWASVEARLIKLGMIANFNRPGSACDASRASTSSQME